MYQSLQPESRKRLPLSAKPILLVIILMITSMLPWGTIQAAPLEQTKPEMDYRFELTASISSGREGAPICVGEKVTFIVRAWRSAEHYQDTHKDLPRQTAVNVKIDALVLDKSLLKFEGPTRQMTGYTFDNPGSVEFTVKALKPGRGQVTFEALFPKNLIDQQTLKQIPASDLTDTLYAQVNKTVDVIECPLELTVLNQYLTQPGDVTQHFVGIIRNARLQKSDEDENLFVYEGLETIVLTERVPECQVTWEKAERLVEIQARRLDNHYHITIKRGPIVMEVTHICENGNNTNQFVVPEAGEQEWDVPLTGGTFERSMRAPMASFWWVIQAISRKP